MKISLEELNAQDVFELFISAFSSQSNDDYKDSISLKYNDCFNKFSDDFYNRIIKDKVPFLYL